MTHILSSARLAGDRSPDVPGGVPRAAGSTAPSSRLATVVALALGAAFAVLWSWLALSNYARYQSADRDVAIYAQVLWNTARGQPFATSALRENDSHLAEHVAPILLPLSLLDRLVPVDRWELVLQQAALALAGAPVYLLARRHLGAWRALAVLGSFYLAPLLSEVAYGVGNRGFHPVALTTVPLGFGAYFMLAGRPRPGVLVALSTLLVEETSALALCGLGLMLLCHRQVRLGLLLAGAAAAWLAVVTLVLMPSFHVAETLPGEGNRTVAKFRALREDPTQALGLLAERLPATAEWWLLPSAALGLLAPQVLIAAAPTATVLLALDRYDPWTHRAAPMLPLLWLAATLGLARLRRGRLQDLALGVLLVASLATFVRDSPLPGGGRFVPGLLEWTERSEALRRAVQAVPPAVSVAASAEAATHLAAREHLYFIGTTADEIVAPVRAPSRYDWWVLDLTNSAVRRRLVDSSRGPLQEHRAPYDVWLLDDQVLVAAQGVPLPSRPIEAQFGGMLMLEGADVQRLPDRTIVRLAWRVKGELKRDFVRWLELLDAAGRVLAERAGPSAEQFFGTSDWVQGQLIVEDVTFRSDGAVPPDPSSLRVAWFRPQSGDVLLTPDGGRSLEIALPAP